MLHLLLSLLVAAVLTPISILVLRRAEVLDVPGERSSHRTPTVRGGGVAVVAATVGVASATGTFSDVRGWALVSGAVVLALVGLLDDLGRGLSATGRLVAQFAVASCSVPIIMGVDAGMTVGAALLVSAAVVSVVGYVNAYNFMDGINGISALQAVVAGSAYILLGHLAEEVVLTAAGALVAGASLGFLPYNFPRAKIFLGDVGSYFIGCWLALTAVTAVASGLPPEAAGGVLVVYVGDTVATLVRKIAQGRRWSEPHRDHAYQRLVRAGWSHGRSASLVASASLLTGALGLVSLGDSIALRVAADAAMCLVVVAYLVVAERVGGAVAARVET